MTTSVANPTRTLGRTGIEVTALSFGAMELRGEPRGRAISKETANTVLNAVLDEGINFIDTSIDYGLSEGLIGAANTSWPASAAAWWAQCLPPGDNARLTCSRGKTSNAA